MSMLLVISICTGIAIPAFARSIDAVEQEQKTYNGESCCAVAEFDDIFISKSGQYFMCLPESTGKETSMICDTVEIAESREFLIPVEKIEIDISNKNCITALSQRNDIPQIIVDDLIANYEDYKEVENLPQVTLFAPYASSKDEEYKIIDGFRMKTFRIYINGGSTSWMIVKKGKNTKETAKTMKDVLVQAISFGGSAAAKTVSYFASGISVFQAFLNFTKMTENTIVSSTEDYVQMRFVFDTIKQYTSTDYGNPGDEDYQVQLVTYKTTITQIGEEVYFANTGKGPSTDDRECHVEIQSGHFDDPWETAFKRGRQNPGYEDITYTTGGVTFTFAR